jgi:hypothetical protein
MLKNFSVPVPLHLLRFAEKEYFEGMKPPYKVTERTLLGKHIMFLLNDKRSFELDEQALSFEEYIEISLSEELMKLSSRACCCGSKLRVPPALARLKV